MNLRQWMIGATMVLSMVAGVGTAAGLPVRVFAARNVAAMLTSQLKVVAANAQTISARDIRGRAVAIQITAATLYQEHGAAASLADVRPGVLVDVKGSAANQGTAALQATSIVIVPEQVAGVVTMAAHGALRVTSIDGITRSLELDRHTVLLRAGHRVTSADLAAGQAVTLEGFDASAGALHATSVTIQLPHVSGTLTAGSGSTFSLTGAYGALYSVTLATDVIVHNSVGSTVAVSALAEGAQLDVEGFLDAGGSAITAERVTIVGGKRIPPLETPVPMASLTLTQADNGHTLIMTVGERLVLELSGAVHRSWDLQVGNPDVLVREVLPLPSGVQGIFIAKEPGQTTLRATGTPICPSNGSCTLQTANFSVTVIVQ